MGGEHSAYIQHTFSYLYSQTLIEGSLEVKLPTIWTDGKAEVRSEKRKSEKKEDAGARKGSKAAKHCVFPMICGSGGSKSRLAKAAGVEPCGQMRDEKLHAVVARSTIPSQNVQNTSCLDGFWKLRCRKSARRCGAKPKSKCPKHTRVGALLEVEMSKKCTPLWREAHVEVKMHKTPHVWTTFGSCDVEKVHAIVARSTCGSQNVQNTACLDDFWKLRCRKSACPCGAKHISKSKVKSVKIWRVRSTFGRSDVVLRGRRKGLCTLSKMSKTWGFLAFPKTMAGVGRLKRIWKDAFSVAGAVQETCSSEMLGGQGADFLRGVAFWSIRFSGRWFCVTGATLCMTWHHFVVAGAILQRHGLEKCKTHWYEAVSSAFNFPLLKEVSQNCFVFDVANFGGSLAE